METQPTVARAITSVPVVDARYVDLDSIAVGMADVHRVRDSVLGRTLLMKILPGGADPEARAAFRAEIELQARLQHPAIVPLHDAGEGPDGQIWFTMPELSGATLARSLHQELRGLVRALEVVARAVAYAHDQGVVHRDIKPENILLGAFGEVYVLDWGIAHRAGATPRMVAGTRGYMAPEQASGLPSDASADVFGLGATLYAVLAGHAPDASRAGAPPPPPPGPDELVLLCRRAMAFHPADRPPTATAFADALLAWLDDEQRRARARALVAATVSDAEAVDRLEAERTEAQADARRRIAAVAPSSPVSTKLPAWNAEERVTRLARACTLAELSYEQKLRGALEVDPGCAEAHAALARLHRRQFERAETVGDGEAAARSEHLLRTHARGEALAWVDAPGAVTLHSVPPASVRIDREERVDRRMAAREVWRGEGPVDALELPPGSYVATLTAPGHAAVRYPFRIRRAEHWDGIPPGGGDTTPIHLPAEGELGADDVLIPAGWTPLGGDPQAVDGLPTSRLWIDAFVIRRHPVTLAEYGEFLRTLAREGVDWRPFAPPVDPADPSGSRMFVAGPEGPVPITPMPPWGPQRPDHPMVQLSWRDAHAYARARGWRLPHEYEREKAARGVDGRTLPWGDWFEPTWAAVLDAFPGPPHPLAVGQPPEDVSVYGVRGLAGNVRDHCQNPYRREGPPTRDGRILPDTEDDAPFRALRGGAWRSAAYLCRPARRFGAPPGAWSSVAGCRLARDFTR